MSRSSPTIISPRPLHDHVDLLDARVGMERLLAVRPALHPRDREVRGVEVAVPEQQIRRLASSFLSRTLLELTHEHGVPPSCRATYIMDRTSPHGNEQRRLNHPPKFTKASIRLV